jgi:hypothetical protein
MSALLTDPQPSGIHWGPPTFGTHFYEPTQRVAERLGEDRQLIDLEQLQRQVERYEAEYRRTLEELAKLYVFFPADESVQHLLRRQRAITGLLLECHTHLHRFFGEDVLLELKASSDEYGWLTLYVEVRWPGSAAEAFAGLERFYDEWWLARSLAAGGSLNFTYRLI